MVVFPVGVDGAVTKVLPPSSVYAQLKNRLWLGFAVPAPTRRPTLASQATVPGCLPSASARGSFDVRGDLRDHEPRVLDDGDGARR